MRAWLPIGALLGPLLLLGLASYALTQRTLREAVRIEHATAARLAGTSLNLFFSAAGEKADLWVRLPGVHKALAQHDAAAMRVRLRALVEADRHLSRAFITDGNGRLWSDWPEVPAVAGQDFSQREWFQGVSRSAHQYLSGVYRRLAAPQTMVLALATPYSQGADQRLVLVLQYSLANLRRFAFDVPMGQDAWLLLLDPSGQVALHPRLGPEGPALDGYASLEAVREALQGRESGQEALDPLSGQLVVVTANPLNLLGRTWALVAVQPEASAYQSLHVLRLELGLAALLLAALGVWLARRLRHLHEQVIATNQVLEEQNEELSSLTEELQESNANLHDENEARREAEEELTSIQNHLQELVEERTAALAQKEQQFQQAQKMESVGRLAGGIAHDFNNMLTVVLGHSELIKDETDLARIRESAASIHEAAVRSARLTSQLLGFARRQVIKAQPVDLASLVTTTSALLLPLLGESLKLELELEAALPPVLADPGQLEQVLMNLAVNARDAVAGSGGRVVIGARRVRDDDRVAEAPAGPGRGHCAVLYVADNGCGIEPELLQAIFEPFYTTKPVGKGTGLGLAMVKGSVQQAGGQVEVLSRKGEGTEFRIYLPLTGPAQAAQSENAVPEAATPTGASVLLVEDEPSLRALAKQVLVRAGYRVMDAPDAAAGLAAAKALAEPLDLLVTDLVMPGGNGLDLANALADGQLGLRVILMTGYTESSLPEEARRRFRFLQKPFSPAAFLKAVKEALA